MEPLRGTDPGRLAGHRILGRLGAGGMGVVYLARSPGGSLAALKVIHAEYARDAGFRARFRREVAAAGRIESPWVVPLTDADPDADAPWLATAYVPGPSLAEAVAAYGALPEDAVRVLGARLASALRDVHAAGLVHRDVKPGNVLLAVDGPRLIDFGIARAAGTSDDTVLTASGVVVGTPGYLSPEQARGDDGQGVGAPSDVFALGCLLAYATTGRPPFGAGMVDALLFRAVHEEADLDGVPRALAPVLRSCLAKEPERRPTAAALADSLAEGPAERTADGAEQRAGWLPGPLLRLVAERSEAGTALPDVEPTEVDAAGEGGGARGAERAAPATPPAADAPATDARSARGPGRRRLLLAGAATALAVGGGLTARSALSGGDGARGRHAPGGAEVALGLHADLSGDHRAIGTAQERGVRLAVEEHNARADTDVRVAVRVEDDGGDPDRAERAARRLTEDRAVLAVVGPTTDAAALSSLATYDGALMPVLAVSPGPVRLYVLGSRSLVHMRPHDSLLPFFLSAHLRGEAGSRSIGVLSDRMAGDHGWEIGSTLSRVLHDAGHPVVPRVVSALSGDFGPPVEALLDAGADSVVFAGHHDRAALLARELHRRDFPGARAAAHGVLDARFPSAAGEAAEGWVVAAPVLDATVAPRARDFAEAHRKRFGSAPRWYAAEAYDAARLALRELTGLPRARRERDHLTTALRGAAYEGIAKSYAFEPETGAMVIDGGGVFLWKVTGGRFRYLGPASHVVPG
ncbi:bifunctional serine/threonine-protein kinase/ABC transporter substrate-binding protein [Streptomyces chumphonensis]|uniref:bifunctional serine/threonine-protein kinase/ABC transporter substrate-binding protein n=1 Tax=Streptomyces chumphonensis TaxID=1214925 RepID=UPI003D73AC43